jgi:Lhr-like helicase
LIRVQVGDVKKVDIVPTPTTKEELVEYLVGTKWEFFDEKNKKIGITQFNKDGTYTTWWGEKVPWSATSARTVVVQHGDWRRILTFSQDYCTYDEATVGANGSLQAKLLREK